jgi:hypothetical protein
MSTKNTLKSFITNYGTKIDGAFAFLLEGGEFSVAEAKRAGIRRPDDMIYRLRITGNEVFTNVRRDAAGNKIKRYRAAAYLRTAYAMGAL